MQDIKLSEVPEALAWFGGALCIVAPIVAGAVWWVVIRRQEQAESAEDLARRLRHIERNEGTR